MKKIFNTKKFISNYIFNFLFSSFIFFYCAISPAQTSLTRRAADIASTTSAQKAFVCRIQESYSLIHEKSLTIDSGEKIFLFENEEFKFWVSSLASEQYELEIFHKSDPQRSYAKAQMTKSGDLLSWAHWSREHLIEATCTLQVIPAAAWKTSCLTGQYREQKFDQLKVTTTENFHYDSACQKPFITLKTVGDIALTTQTEQMNFTFGQAEIILHTPSIVEDYNTRQVCGFQNWVLSEAKNVTGLRCALMNGTRPSPMPATGQKKFGIYKLENEKLFLGQLTPELDGSTPEKRPKHWNEKFFYLRHFDNL